MQAATNSQGLTIINFGMGSPNAATIMDLLTAYHPEAVLFLGKCGGLKRSTEIGNFHLAHRCHPAAREPPTDYPAQTRSRVTFLQTAQVCLRKTCGAQPGVPHRGSSTPPTVVCGSTTKISSFNCENNTPIAIDMESATVFVVGHRNEIARGALLLVSDLPMTHEGVKTQKSDAAVTSRWADVHLDIGIESLTDIGDKGEKIKHFQY